MPKFLAFFIRKLKNKKGVIKFKFIVFIIFSLLMLPTLVSCPKEKALLMNNTFFLKIIGFITFKSLKKLFSFDKSKFTFFIEKTG